MTLSTRSRRARARAPPAAAASPRLLARLYGSANLALRTRLVACLVRPLGSLGVAAVAAGAFTVVLARRGGGGLGVAMADVAGSPKDQIAELARFVEQVSPEALQQAAALVSENRSASAPSPPRSRSCSRSSCAAPSARRAPAARRPIRRPAT